MATPNPQIENSQQKLLESNSEQGHAKFIEQEEKKVETAKYHYYLWLSRMFIMFAVLSLIVLLSSSLSLFNLAPQVTVEPFLIIKQDTSDGIVRYEPIALDMASKKQLMELFVKQYVILRNTIIRDEKEMMLRWYPANVRTAAPIKSWKPARSTFWLRAESVRLKSHRRMRGAVF